MQSYVLHRYFHVPYKAHVSTHHICVMQPIIFGLVLCCSAVLVSTRRHHSIFVWESGSRIMDGSFSLMFRNVLNWNQNGAGEDRGKEQDKTVSLKPAVDSEVWFWGGFNMTVSSLLSSSSFLFCASFNPPLFSETVQEGLIRNEEN